jgi:hypothetical protein
MHEFFGCCCCWCIIGSVCGKGLVPGCLEIREIDSRKDGKGEKGVPVIMGMCRMKRMK